MRWIIGLIFGLSYLLAYVGIISAKVGQVSIKRGGNILEAKVGTKIEKDDLIEIGKFARAQIIFKDRSVITLGSNAKVKIRDYLFDGTKNSRFNVDIKSGAFKFISGKIGKIARGNFKIKTRTATIGIRGTIGGADRTHTKFFTLYGKIVIKPKGMNRTFEIPKGFYREIKNNKVTPPKKITTAFIKKAKIDEVITPVVKVKKVKTKKENVVNKPKKIDAKKVERKIEIKKEQKIKAPKIKEAKVIKEKATKPKIRKPEIKQPKVEKPKIELPEIKKPEVKKPKIELPVIKKELIRKEKEVKNIVNTIKKEIETALKEKEKKFKNLFNRKKNQKKEQYIQSATYSGYVEGEVFDSKNNKRYEAKGNIKLKADFKKSEISGSMNFKENSKRGYEWQSEITNGKIENDKFKSDLKVKVVKRGFFFKREIDRGEGKMEGSFLENRTKIEGNFNIKTNRGDEAKGKFEGKKN